MSPLKTLLLLVLAVPALSGWLVLPEPADDARDLQQATTSATPTMGPTESPAPSPSPSATPTTLPTITGKPTPAPSEMPTESPAPSPSPSATPTQQPTQSPSETPSIQPTTTPFPTGTPSLQPSDSPSGTPSGAPSSAPSLSAMPSDLPSSTPSVEPSATPSISAMPSDQPSMAPSKSMMPSSSPSYEATLSAEFVVNLGIEEILNATHVAAFEEATKTFMQQQSLQGGRMSQVEVTLTDQLMGVRRLMVGRQLKNKDTVTMYFDVQGVYIGSDNDFDLLETFNSTFNEESKERELWIHLMGNEDPYFLPLRPTPAGIQAPPDPEDSTTGLTKGAYASVVLVAVGAALLGMGAAIYSVRSYRMAHRGTELRSPSRNPHAAPFSPSAVNMDEVTDAKFDTSDNMPLSPNSLESGKSSPSGVSKQGIFCGTEQAAPAIPIQFSKTTSSSTRDPPTRSEDMFGGRERSLFDGTETQSEASVSAMSKPRGPAVATVGRIPSQLPNNRGQIDDDGHELLLTKSMGGTLGAAPVDGSTAGASDFSFFSSVVGGGKKKQPPKPEKSQSIHRLESKQEVQPPTQGTAGFLGARVTGATNPAPLDNRQRAGLYDVFAPAGPIGIVVDTTKYGPAVHSLKPTSPMLGLINPGDLIVGLDDEDTRGMTAATLTRLMARKANQKDRKITLLTTDGY